MTAKEKAEELFDKMANEICQTDAKVCALIAVDRIIKELKDFAFNYDIEETVANIYYWEEVKQEINKL